MASENKPSIMRALPQGIIENVIVNTGRKLDVDNNICISNPKVIYEVAMSFLEGLAAECANQVNANEEAIEVNLDNFMTLRIENRQSDTGDKAGNLIPVLEAGPRLKLIVKNDGLTEDMD